MDEVYGPRSAMVSAQAWEIGKLKAEVFRLQTALADATERAEANATEMHLLGERVRIECERRDQARRERDAAIVRADALAARLAEVDDREHPS